MQFGLVFPLLANAQNTSTRAASTLYLAETKTQFSLNVANNSDDVFIYSSSPAYAWVGFGFGQQMQGSLMFVMYPSHNGHNVTLSPRIGSKNAEPTFDSNINVQVLPGTTANESMLLVQAVCHNCRHFFNVKDTKQPVMYALGHASRLYSNSPSADLNRHVRYGHFKMDMVAATGAGGVPAKSDVQSGVTMVGAMVRDDDCANLAHAIIACLALFVIWPLNVLVAGFFQNMRIHMGASIVILAFLAVAYALGISTSAQFNRSKDYNSPHQICAFLALAPILLTSLLPMPNISRFHTCIPRLRTPLVSTTFVALVLTGGLGLSLSSQVRPVILAYTAVALLVFLLTLLLHLYIRRRSSAYAARAAYKKRRSGAESNDDDHHMLMLSHMTDMTAPKTSSNTNHHGNNHIPHVRTYSPKSTDFAPANAHRQPRPMYGGGTMPGPQYLLNMHPGVPVHKW
ncbi:hypothetical protein ACEQ8H_005092 [Pleosporales sp. CAS-2024a]